MTWPCWDLVGHHGRAKGDVHFHRDLMIVAGGYAKEVLNVTPDDVFVVRRRLPSHSGSGD